MSNIPLPSSNFTPSKNIDFSLRWILLGVLFFHMGTTWWLSYSSPQQSNKTFKPKINVKTVSLSTPSISPAPLASSNPIEAPKTEGKPKTETPKPVSIEKSKPVKETKPSTLETKRTPVEVKKPVEKKKTEEIKKSSTPPKPAPTKSSELSKTNGQSAKPKTEAIKKPTAEEIAAKQAEQDKQKAQAAMQETARLQQQASLAQAKEKLAKLGEKRPVANALLPTSHLEETILPKRLENLQIDAISFEGTENISLTTQESSYRDEIAYRLKLSLRLPEYGMVKVRLTLERSGHVANLQIVSSESTKNRAYIESMIPSIKFPPFGNDLTQANQYTFLIALNNDH